MKQYPRLDRVTSKGVKQKYQYLGTLDAWYVAQFTQSEDPITGDDLLQDKQETLAEK